MTQRQEFIQACIDAIGADAVNSSATKIAQTCHDWRGVYRDAHWPNCWAVIAPADTAQVQQIVCLCRHAQVAIVPQGGNSGLVLASAPTPQMNRPTIVLSLRRLNTIAAIDRVNRTVLVGAGAILADVQRAAQAADFDFPIRLAAEETCTIGGNLATNAGGVHVVRYGMMRRWCLGVEAINAAGECWDGLTTLYKNNSGYDWRNLLIGSEGTLGIITRAVLCLEPLAQARSAAWVQCPDLSSVMQLFAWVQDTLSDQLCAFELMQQACVAWVSDSDQQRVPWQQTQPFAVLLEVCQRSDQGLLEQRLQEALAHAINAGWAQTVLCSQSESQRQAFWSVRETIPLVEPKPAVKHDIALPISAVEPFVIDIAARLTQQFPLARPYYFGHIGDGNLHYNVCLPASWVTTPTQIQDYAPQIQQLVYTCAYEYGGSLSAEHGIGRVRLDSFAQLHPAPVLDLMRTIKKALDPDNLLNPGVIVDSDCYRLPS